MSKALKFLIQFVINVLAVHVFRLRRHDIFSANYISLVCKNANVK